MGRQILGLQPGDSTQCDHENHNTLDYTRGNIREATRKQQCQNRRRRADNVSTYKGVSWDRGCSKKGRWKVQIWLDRSNVLIGRFDDPVEGAKAYDKRARQEFGPFALCNFPL
jgi:hypothetical protein